MKKIAVFASGNGSNFQVIAEEFPVEFVFSDHRDAYVLERADKLGVLSYAFELKEFENKAEYEEAIVNLLDQHQIDLVCLAGYMKIVGPTLLAAYEGRIINIHPAYLPEFPGAHGIEDAWNAGVTESGVTIHWVDSGVDTGKVIKQVRVPRLADDTIESFEARIHEAEYKLYPEVLDSLGGRRLIVEEEYRKIDGYTEFFSFFFNENKKEEISEKLWAFARKNMYMIDEQKDEAWKSLNSRIDARLDKSEVYIKKNENTKVYVRTFGNKGNSETKSLLECFYKYVFGNKEVISFDSSNNSAPSSTLTKYTNYTKYKKKRNHKSKKLLLNYQVSHVFGKTLNCYAFTAPWNIVYLPKILDPFTGHESKGELTERFTEKIQDFVKSNYSEQILDFNQTMEELSPKIKQFKKEIKDNNIKEINEKNIKEDTLKQFFKSLDENFSQIDL